MPAPQELTHRVLTDEACSTNDQCPHAPTLLDPREGVLAKSPNVEPATAASVPGLVYTLTPAQQTLVELAYRGFVVPSSHRVVMPLLLASLLLFWQRERPPQRRTHVASSSLPLHVE
jgi:hypothetical protein